MSIDIDDIEGTPEKPDFRRANGAPMYYDDNGKNQRGSRPSGWGKELDDENALVNWKIDRAASGVAHDKALQARYVAIDLDDPDTKPQRSTLRQAAINAGRGDEASDIGTALHSMSERWEQDDEFSPPEPYLSSLTSYGEGLERLGLESVLFEYQVVNETYRAAGTADRLWVTTKPLVTPDGEILPVGTLILGDLKTGKTLDFSLPGYFVQMYLYASGRRYDVIADGFHDDQPEVNQRWAIIAHMPSVGGGCEFIWVDLSVGEFGAYLVQQVRTWRKMWKSNEYGAPAVQVHVADTEIAEALDAEIQPVEVADTEWIDKMVPYIRHRLAQINEHEAARKQLLVFWPKGLPTPKQGYTDVEQVSTVLGLLDKIEADHGLTFVGDNPNIEPGVHSSEVNRSNKPASPEAAPTTKENE